MGEIKFNEQQLAAINTYKGAYGVMSSAGSGKSTVLLNRIKFLINDKGVEERNILAITFTRNTALELKSKLKKMGYYMLNVGTFHSICRRILISEGYELEGRNMIKEWQIENCLKKVNQHVDVDNVMSFISYQKNYMKSPEDEFAEKDANYTTEDLREFYKAYEEFKDENDLFDFDDLLLVCLDVLRKNKGKYTYDFILVDEHQDSNTVQNLLLQEWCESGNLFAVGDGKQAIYGFRSGNPKHLMNMEEYWDNPTILHLDTNYRSAKNIIEKSNNFIRPYFANYEHHHDAVAHRQDDGEITVKSYAGREFEAEHVADKIEKFIEEGIELKEIAVLYRNNDFPNFLEGELKARDIEYDIANDSSFFKRKEIAGIIAYLRLAHDLEDNAAFESVFKLRNFPLKFLSQKVYRDIVSNAEQNDISLYESLRTMEYDKEWIERNVSIFVSKISQLRTAIKLSGDVKDLIDEVVGLFNIKGYIEERYSNEDEIKERIESIYVLKSFVKNNNLEQFITYVYSTEQSKKKKEDAVQLMSIHKSKGLEWEYTFVIGVEDGKFPSDRSSLDEEARLFYVAVTRAKKGLYVSEIGRGNQFIKEYGYIEEGATV